VKKKKKRRKKHVRKGRLQRAKRTQTLRPSRPLSERKRVAVCQPLIDSSDDEE
jgi:hypothetical protein